MRRILLVAAAAWSLLAPAGVLRAQPAAPPHFAAKLSPAELKIETALAKPVKLSYHEQHLKDVIADLAKQADLPIELDPEGLEEADVSPDQLVNLEMGTLGLRQGLDVLLPPLHLAIVLQGPGLTITAEESERQLIVRVYPVIDLVRLAPPRDGVVFDFDTLIDTLTSNLSPDTWTDNGGAGSIEAGPGGCLVVSQTYGGHLDIERLITGLRRLKSDHAALKPGDVGPIIELIKSKPVRDALAERSSINVDTDLKSYVEEVAKTIKLPIVLDAEGLEESDATPDQMIHVEYRDARLRDAFRHTLSKLHLNYFVRDGYLEVTSFEKKSEAPDTRIYPVGDLAPLRAVQDPPIRDFDSLIELITSSSDHAGEWAENGGNSHISGWREPAALIICTTDEVHDDVEQLLAQLRETDIAAFNADQAKIDQQIVERIYPLYMAQREADALIAKVESEKAEKKTDVEKPAKGEKTPTAEEVAELIAEMLPEVSFKEKGTLLRPFHDRLIVRHRPAMLHKIEKLLEKIDAWPSQQNGMGGGGFFDLQPDGTRK